jgi:hypothetical protein
VECYHDASPACLFRENKTIIGSNLLTAAAAAAGAPSSKVWLAALAALPAPAPFRVGRAGVNLLAGAAAAATVAAAAGAPSS